VLSIELTCRILPANGADARTKPAEIKKYIGSSSISMCELWREAKASPKTYSIIK